MLSSIASTIYGGGEHFKRGSNSEEFLQIISNVVTEYIRVSEDHSKGRNQRHHRNHDEIGAGVVSQINWSHTRLWLRFMHLMHHLGVNVQDPSQNEFWQLYVLSMYHIVLDNLYTYARLMLADGQIHHVASHRSATDHLVKKAIDATFVESGYGAKFETVVGTAINTVYEGLKMVPGVEKVTNALPETTWNKWFIEILSHGKCLEHLRKRAEDIVKHAKEDATASTVLLLQNRPYIVVDESSNLPAVSDESSSSSNFPAVWDGSSSSSSNSPPEGSSINRRKRPRNN